MLRMPVWTSLTQWTVPILESFADGSVGLKTEIKLLLEEICKGEVMLLVGRWIDELFYGRMLLELHLRSHELCCPRTSGRRSIWKTQDRARKKHRQRVALAGARYLRNMRCCLLPNRVRSAKNSHVAYSARQALKESHITTFSGRPLVSYSTVLVP